ncbi:TIGR04222 domain-containing membrane protein, partial [Amycolatopsis thermalba]|uniref:TIGR04222 domain-containing membrane protein n=1 Tax=Amycolatopsis thermalba TaxID=944492 RepID=UPI001FC95755
MAILSVGDGPAFWGLPASTFLPVFAVLAVLPVVVRTLGPWLLKRRGGGPHQPPGPVELGFLTGGPARATDTALAELIANGRIRVNSTGLLSTTGDRPPAGGLAAAIWASVYGGRGTWTVHDVRAAMRGHAESGRLRDRLAGDGLLVQPGPVRANRRLAMLLLVAVLVIAFVTFPDGTFVLAVLPAGLLWALTDRPARGPARTTAGEAALRAASVTPGWSAKEVALGGLSRYPDPAIATALLSPPPPRKPRRRWGSGSATSGSYGYGCGSSSSCGSSSCGG